jgi:hypothetical protein
MQQLRGGGFAISKGIIISTIQCSHPECNCITLFLNGSWSISKRMTYQVTLAATKTACRRYMSWWRNMDFHNYPKLNQIFAIVGEIEDPILALLRMNHDQRRLVLSHYVHKTANSITGASKRNYGNSIMRILQMAEEFLGLQQFFGNWSLTDSKYKKYQNTLKQTTLEH